MADRFLLTPYFLDQPLPELETLAADDWRIHKPPPRGEDDLVEWLKTVHGPLADWVADTVADGERPVSFAGDCCTTIGVLAGLRRGGLEPVLVWLDAHGDFNTPETSPSGFLGGMPLAILVGRGDLTLPEALGLEPLAESRVVLTDARDLDPPERAALEASEVLHLDDPESLLSEELPPGPLWVHLDTDVVDPRDSPAHNYAAPGGRRSGELVAILGELASRRQVAAVSLSAWNPALDPDGRSRDVSLEMLRALLS